MVKSDILYEKTTRGTSQSLLHRCRDYILLKFRNAEHITRTEIRQRFPIDSTQLQEMLEGIAVPVPGEDGRAPWTFCEPPDVDFMQTHDRIMQLEDERWAKDAAAFVSVPIRVDVGAASSASARSSAAHEDAAANVLPEVGWLNALVEGLADQGRILFTLAHTHTHTHTLPVQIWLLPCPMRLTRTIVRALLTCNIFSPGVGVPITRTCH